jgi:hypothetical protein
MEIHAGQQALTTTGKFGGPMQFTGSVAANGTVSAALASPGGRTLTLSGTVSGANFTGNSPSARPSTRLPSPSIDEKKRGPSPPFRFGANG